MSSTTAATLRPPPDPRGVIVNLTATAAGRPAGFPEGNLQGSVRETGWSGERWCDQLRGGCRGSAAAVRVAAGRSSAEGRGLRADVIGEAIEVLSHADVRRLFDRGGTGAGGAGKAVEVLAEEVLVAFA